MGKHIIKDLLFSAAALCTCVSVGAQVADNTANPTKTFSERIASGDHTWLDGQLQQRYPGLMRGWTSTTSQNVELREAPEVRKVALASTVDGTEIWGLLISSDEWSGQSEQNIPYGVYSFNTSDMQAKSLIGNVGYANGGGSFTNNTLRYTAYGLESTIVAYYYEYDIDTWEVTKTPKTMDGHMISVCSAFDPTTYKTYGVYYGDDFNASSWLFGEIDYDSEKTTKLAEITNICIAMACDNAGQLYGITIDGYLNKIDKTTGKFTKVGNTGVSVKGIMQSAAFDRDNDKMYWAAMTADNQAALYDVDLESGKATLVAAFPNREEPVALYIPRKYEDLAPAAPDNLKLTVKNANTSGAVQFDAPSTTMSGKKLTGDMTYTVTVNGKAIATGEAEAGEDGVTVLVKDLEEGFCNFEVSLKNSKGEGKPAYLKKWVGCDVPQVPQNVTFTVDTENNNFTTLTWDYPNTGGVHGGYADPSEFTYTIVRYPEDVVVSEGSTQRVFTENVPNSKWATHYYKVYAVCNGLKSDAAKSNMIPFGDALDLPYINNISNSTEFNELERFDRGDGYTWIFRSSPTKAFASCRATHPTLASNAWLVTPPMNMRKGYEYELSFQGFANYDEDEYLGVYLGTGRDTAEFKKHEIDPVRVYNGNDVNRTDRKVRFSVDKDGAYRVGFNCVSPALSEYMRVDSIMVREALCYEAPDSVANLKVVAAANGTQQAVISFDAPTKRGNGKELTSITKIDVCCDGVVIKSLEAPKPGEHLSVVDDEAVNGFTTYEVVAYNEAGKGIPASATTYVGIDIPSKPNNVRLKDNFDGTVTLSWDKVTTGMHGQFIPVDQVTYNIYTMKNGSPAMLKADISETSIVINNISQTGAQARFYYAVQSQTEAGSDGYTISNVLLSGAPYNLPFYESFANSTQQSGPWTVASKGAGKFGITNTPSQDNDNGAVVCYPSVIGYEGYLSSPKMKLSNANHPIGSFYYYCTPGKDIGVDVKIIKEGGDTILVKRFDFLDETGATGFRLGKFDLNEFKNDRYDQVLFNFYFNEVGTSILLDNIIIEDMKANDLKVTLSIPVSLRNGQAATATATVENLGENAASGYQVGLYHDGKLLDSKAGETIASGEKKQYELQFAASKIDNAAMTLCAKVDYDKDEDISNNTSVERTVFVYSPTYPVVTDLATDGKQLTWTGVKVSEEPITDGFETYYPLEKTCIGDWSLIDGDEGEPYTFGLNYVESFRTPSAYIVNNPLAIGYDLEYDPAWGPHNGEQYLVAFAVDPNTTLKNGNDDWLISPLLSGKAQTVRAWLKSYSDRYGLENYEVLYSTTGKSKDDFVSLFTGEAPMDWTEISAALPEGTKYFAIRHTSSDKYMFMIDDVTYIPGGLTVKGYNIYRDGSLLANVDASATSYSIEGVEGIHDYVVTVVYEIGESGASNKVSAGTAGIQNVNGSTAVVTSRNGHIYVQNACGKSIEIYTLSGVRVFAVSGRDNADATVAPGAYAVKVGNDAFNIVVSK